MTPRLPDCRQALFSSGCGIRTTSFRLAYLTCTPLSYFSFPVVVCALSFGMLAASCSARSVLLSFILLLAQPAVVILSISRLCRCLAMLSGDMRNTYRAL